MADFSFQNLFNTMTPQVPPSQTPLIDGLSGAAPSADLLAMMRAKQAQQQDPRMISREIDPGQTWGGRDPNAIQPNDVMQSYYNPPPPDRI
jgi:hypothetical protein